MNSYYISQAEKLDWILNFMAGLSKSWLL